VLRLAVVVVGDRGRLRVVNPLAPHLFHRLTVTTGGRHRRERVRGAPTYTYQLQAFVDAVRHGTPVLTPPADSVATMRVIDDVYRAAGLQPRGATR
jgi:predicted dehydrogenase